MIKGNPYEVPGQNDDMSVALTMLTLYDVTLENQITCEITLNQFFF